MRQGRSGPSLGERAALSGVGPPEDGVTARSAAGAPRGADREAGHGRHCWVRDAPGAPGTRPGLLVEWRQREDGWYGRVAHVVDGRHGPVLVEAWLPAVHLHQR
jgi:hypothetical protein